MEKFLKRIEQAKKVLEALTMLALSIGTFLSVIKMLVESLK